MLQTLLFAVGVLAGALIVHLQLRDERRARTADHGAHAEERREWQRERQLLLNRIKPETAQFVTPDETVHAPRAVRYDDDEDYWQSQETREEMAERLAREELEARLAPALDEE